MCSDWIANYKNTENFDFSMGCDVRIQNYHFMDREPSGGAWRARARAVPGALPGSSFPSDVIERFSPW